MVSYIKGGMQAKGTWKQDPEANIWMKMGSGEGNICPFKFVGPNPHVWLWRW